MIEKTYLVGMDLGTTNIKAIITDTEGNLIASASRPNHLIVPGQGMAEEDAHEWWSNAVSIFKEITEKAGQDIVTNIKCISVSSQTVSMLPVDKDGNPLRNALIWMDERSAGELYEILETVGRDRFIQIVGGQPAVAFLSNKLLWFRRNEPELFAKTDKVLQASSYINMKLTGEKTMDIDQASRCQCLDISTFRWSDEIAAALGMDLNEVLPEPRKITDIIGYVTKEAAEETGLAEGIAVVAGASDAMASMYATGLSKLDEATESSGTTSLVFCGVDKASANDVPVVTKPCAIEGMPFVFDAPINASGASLKWFLDTLGHEEVTIAEEKGINVFDYINQLALETVPGSHNLFYFPYLGGERAPLWNSYSRGMFIGLTQATSRADMVRSVFEGTAFAVRHVIETIKESGAAPKALRITGGGAKSKTWCKIKASMLNMPILILDEGSGDVPVGDILIAGSGIGVFNNLTEAMDKFIKVKEVIEPDPEWTRVYDKMYPYYVSMYKSLDADLAKMEKDLIF